MELYSAPGGVEAPASLTTNSSLADKLDDSGLTLMQKFPRFYTDEHR